MTYPLNSLVCPLIIQELSCPVTRRLFSRVIAGLTRGVTPSLTPPMLVRMPGRAAEPGLAAALSTVTYRSVVTWVDGGLRPDAKKNLGSRVASEVLQIVCNLIGW
jgi:hypothetical protein